MKTQHLSFLSTHGFTIGQFFKTELFFEKLSRFKYLSSFAPFASYFFFRRDSLPVGAAKDTIATNIIAKSLEVYPQFRGFCKLSKTQFINSVAERTVHFDRIMRKKLKVEAIISQLTESPFKVNRPAYSRALARVKNHLKIKEASLTPDDIPTAVSKVKVSAGAGFPYFVKKAIVLVDLVIDAAFFTREITSDEFSQLFFFPTYVAYRVQQRPSNVKLRLIYVYPGVITVCEQLFLGPIVDFFLKNNTPYAIGDNGSTLTTRWSRWQKFAFQISLDWTAFDWSANSYVIKDAFSIIKSMFKDLSPKQSAIFDLVTFFFIFTPIYTTNPKTLVDEVVFKRRGVPSGSSFTNLIDTIVNLIVVYYYFETRNIKLDPEQVACLGDDIIISVDRLIDIFDIAKVSNESFGMVLSQDKSKVYKRGEKVYFLGGLINGTGRYIDPQTVLYQIATTTSDMFIKCNNSEEHFIRVHDKLCSILFKYCDSSIIYDYLVRELKAYLGVEPDTGSYTEVYSRLTVPTGRFEATTRNVSYMRSFGWMIQ